MHCHSFEIHGPVVAVVYLRNLKCTLTQLYLCIYICVIYIYISFFPKQRIFIHGPVVAVVCLYAVKCTLTQLYLCISFFHVLA